MGESACLRRSFSDPSECSPGLKEGDPLRCLGESVSFGRYMSEPLAWEKWSAFSHNRYLEEAEKFSKPGSVAQKKAYFEAHYKKKAAEKAAALLEMTNAGASNISGSVTTYGVSHMAIDKEQENVIPTSEVHSADVNGHNPNVEGNQLDIDKVGRPEAVIQESVDENDIQVKILKQFENDKDLNDIVANQEVKMPIKNAADEENQVSKSMKRLMNSSPSLSTQCRASKVPFSPGKQATGAHTTNGKNDTQKGKKFVADLVDKRKLPAKSLHMSIEFTSHAGETGKVVGKTRNSRSNTYNLNVSTSNSTSLRTTSRVSEQPSADPWSKDKRTKTLLNKSVAGVVAEDLWKLPKTEQSLIVNASKSRAPVTSSPFSFRSEERAEKRKEFFQRLEEKKNAKEAENKKVQMRSNNKEKAVQDVNKPRQNTGLKSKVNQDTGSQLPSNHFNKISVAQSRPPRLGRQSTVSKVLNLSSRPSVNSQSSKYATQRYDPNTNQLVTFLSKKNTHENCPPNIPS